MKLSRSQQIFTANISCLIAYATSEGIGMTVGDAYRPQELQLLYYHGFTLKEDNGVLKLVKSNKRSNTLESNHAKRLAQDFNHFIGGVLTYEKALLQKLGDYWESLHPKNRWGGNFKSILDVPHYEMNI